jgi:predicted membrane-bound spermidine synthase
MATRLWFEHHGEPLLPMKLFAKRVFRFSAISTGIMLFSLGFGIFGYRYFENQAWIDALLNASMIMGGMGPVSQLHTISGKLFASFYALYCGAILLISIGIFLAPIVHRILHRFHLDIEPDEN